MASKKLKAVESTPSVKELKKQIEDAKAQMRKHGEAALKGAFKEFFDKAPEVTAIRWTQYTPYFNDGEPCEFSVHDFHFKLAEGADTGGFYTYDEGEDGGPFYETSWRDGSKLSEACNTFEADVKDDELFEFAFDDHVQVTATRDGFAVEEYSHD